MEYQTLYEQYYTSVYRLALLLLKNPQDAEDAAQSVFLKLMEKQPVFADENHQKAWLLTVTRNHCRDIQRSFWHKKRTDFEHLPEQAAEPFDKQSGLLFEIIQTLPPPNSARSFICTILRIMRFGKSPCCSTGKRVPYSPS